MIDFARNMSPVFKKRASGIYINAFICIFKADF